ncbi:hypothetical protein POSPLADRAFT_1037934 [Postia placenta MAD-698-R-SB12]|uniref:Protein YOP1 n=1 Tax=Postia placenta MAD-698-R-SB12 TaxID=670580 RepID=A0A1X6NF61_9APHY|nr:hypothetical protein POSPLADRAFT_1037934 [Postia placenta MAD-698-R-SB12]OSX67275.1 hypothetical protein POSPLADRAFT_1037934 [Postia placenta MAD-698-R-SB12]
MLTSLASNLLSAWFAFLLPCYGTWKSLAHRPVSEPELERWAMYWSVLGAFVAFEYVAEWLVSWLPFYWEIKTLFLLFLALPQTQGSTWFYVTFMNPYLTKNEAEIDAGIVQAKENIITFLQNRVQAIWQSVLDSAAQASANGAQDLAAAQNPVNIAKGLLSAFAPSLMGALQGQATAAHQRPVPSPAQSSSSIHSVESSASEE